MDEQNKDQVALESQDQEPAILKPPGTSDYNENYSEIPQTNSFFFYLQRSA